MELEIGSLGGRTGNAADGMMVQHTPGIYLLTNLKTRLKTFSDQSGDPRSKRTGSSRTGSLSLSHANGAEQPAGRDGGGGYFSTFLEFLRWSKVKVKPHKDLFFGQ